MSELINVKISDTQKRGTLKVVNKINKRRPMIKVNYLPVQLEVVLIKSKDIDDNTPIGFITLDFYLTAKDNDKLHYMNITSYEIVMIFLKNSLKFNQIVSSYDNHIISTSQSGSNIDANLNFFDFDGFMDFTHNASNIDYANILYQDYGYGNYIAGNESYNILSIGENGGESYDYYANIDYANVSISNISYDNLTDYVDVMSLRFNGNIETSLDTNDKIHLLRVKLDRNEPDSRYLYTNHASANVDYTTHFYNRLHIVESEQGNYVTGMVTNSFTGGVHICL